MAGLYYGTQYGIPSFESKLSSLSTLFSTNDVKIAQFLYAIFTYLVSVL